MRPSPPRYMTVLSSSCLYLKSAMTAETMLEAENAMASNPASRGMSSSCGSDRNVTDALKMTAAYVTTQHPYISSQAHETGTRKHSLQDTRTRSP